jgi:DNA (cytosine-5)-methyltransferase 1
MAFPESFIIPVSNNQAYRQFVNAVVSRVVEAIANEVVKSSHNPLQLIFTKKFYASCVRNS